MSELLRLYGPDELGPDGYPNAWHHGVIEGRAVDGRLPPIKAYVRELASHRCLRCGHPYSVGEHGDGEWSPCDEQCTHGGPFRYRAAGEGDPWRIAPPGAVFESHEFGPEGALVQRWEAQAKWRILTVHHLNGVKWDCRWWNLVALCQRCHLTIQRRVVLEQVWVHPHTEWFKPYAAAWYASVYLDEDLTRDETMARLDELLALELDPSYTR